MPVCWSACHIILVGGLSSADWNARGVDGGASMPTSDGTTHAVVQEFPKVVKRRRNELQVLENRDLCRILVSFIPKPAQL